MPNGTHIEPQLASVRAGRQIITCNSGPHAGASRLKIYKVSAIGRPPPNKLKMLLACLATVAK